MKNEQTMMNYEAPQVEIIEVAVEKGFAASPGVNDPDDFPDGGNPFQQ